MPYWLYDYWTNTPKGSQLPLTLDVEKFADVKLAYTLVAHFLTFSQARRFEIMAMRDSIVNAG